MAADLARDDLARLQSRVNDCRERLRAVDESKSHQWAKANAAWLLARENLRVALYDHADALLALATEALDRRDGLVFGPQFDGANHVVAVDGCRYTVWAMDGQYRVFVYASMHGKLVGSFATEAEAIEAARAHDVARRGGK